MEYDNTNRGALYKNENKNEDRHPDYSGSINVGGKDYWLSGWLKESKKDGRKFFSLSVKAKAKENPYKPKAQPNEDLNDPIPF